jgi:hypothetical protein
VAIGQPFEVANKIRAPIPAPNNTHRNWFFHMIVDRSVCRLFTATLFAALVVGAG